MALLIHDGKKSEDLLLKYGTIPEPISTDYSELNIFQITPKHQLEGG